jgi:hypothetical protein
MKRKSHASKFKAKVAIEALKGHQTIKAYYDDAHWYFQTALFKESSSFTHKKFIDEVKRHTAKTAEADSDRAQKREIFIHHYYLRVPSSLLISPRFS